VLKGISLSDYCLSKEDYLVQQILPLLRNTANELRNVI